MTLDDITQRFQDQVNKAPNIGKTLKFVFDEGVVFLDLSTDQPTITNDDKDADCTITTKISTFEKIISGKTNPMTAVMMGKVKIKGDMSVAMKLQSLLG